MYKTKLQELCQRKKWALPCYTSMKDGPDHIPEFKASVVVNGLSFDSPASCKSSKDAHNHAAMLAFLHFTSPSDCSTWNVEPKIEEVKKEEKGAEIQSDAMSFTDGEESVLKDSQCYVAEYANRSELPKEEKAAAAKAGLMSRSLDSFQKGESGIYKNLLLELTKRECLCLPIYKTTRSDAHLAPTFFSSVEVEGTMFHGMAGKSVKQAVHSAAMIAYKSLNEHSAEKLLAHVKLTSEDCNSFAATMKNEEKETISAGKQFSFPNSKPSHEELLMFPRSTHPNLFGISDTRNVRNTTRTRSYLLCNKVRVYTEFPDFTFPKGITVLPIAEDKWVAISLEFPNEESN